MKRNRTGLCIQFFHHLLSGLMVSGIFASIGNDAAQMLSLLKYSTFCVVFCTFTHTMIPILLFPLEGKILETEYFNRWYGFKAYYSALTVSTLPLLIILVSMFSTIVYFLTDQPNDTDRFIGFCVVLVTVSYTSQALGYLIGSIFDITKGSIVGSAVLVPLIIISLH
ncbi:ABC2 membrane domain containing protein, partial [Asbolus verrucosus]